MTLRHYLAERVGEQHHCLIRLSEPLRESYYHYSDRQNIPSPLNNSTSSNMFINGVTLTVSEILTQNLLYRIWGCPIEVKRTGTLIRKRPLQYQPITA